MKLILTAPVAKLGVPGDIVEVKDGYGRNYLLPQNYAIKWTRGAEAQIKDITRARKAKEIKSKEEAEQIRSQLEHLVVQVTVQVGENGRLFGAVTPGDIALAVRKAGGPALEKRSIEITNRSRPSASTLSASSCMTLLRVTSRSRLFPPRDLTYTQT